MKLIKVTDISWYFYDDVGRVSNKLRFRQCIFHDVHGFDNDIQNTQCTFRLPVEAQLKLIDELSDAYLIAVSLLVIIFRRRRIECDFFLRLAA